MPDKALALITGASGGIGLALAERCARAGHPLLLVARRAAELEKLARTLTATNQVPVAVHACDLAYADAVQRLHEYCVEQALKPGILINNAGVGAVGRFADLPWERHEAILRLNIVAAMSLTYRFLPGLIAAGGGRIMNVASIAAYQPGPLMAVYYASKSCLLSWSQALAVELKAQRISVTALCPGPTHTGFAQEAGVGNSRLFNSPLVQTAERVAEVGYRSMMRGRSLAIPGLSNRLLATATRCIPASWAARIAYGLHQGMAQAQPPA